MRARRALSGVGYCGVARPARAARVGGTGVAWDALVSRVVLF